MERDKNKQRDGMKLPSTKHQPVALSSLHISMSLPFNIFLFLFHTPFLFLLPPFILSTSQNVTQSWQTHWRFLKPNHKQWLLFFVPFSQLSSLLSSSYFTLAASSSPQLPTISPQKNENSLLITVPKTKQLRLFPLLGLTLNVFSHLNQTPYKKLLLAQLTITLQSNLHVLPQGPFTNPSFLFHPMIRSPAPFIRYPNPIFAPTSFSSLYVTTSTLVPYVGKYSRARFISNNTSP